MWDTFGEDIGVAASVTFQSSRVLLRAVRLTTETTHVWRNHNGPIQNN